MEANIPLATEEQERREKERLAREEVARERPQQVQVAAKQADALYRQIDRAHVKKVSDEINAGASAPNDYYIKNFAGRKPLCFHKVCTTCDGNIRLIGELYALYDRYPGIEPPARK
jgi:hypothetical protein